MISKILDKVYYFLGHNFDIYQDRKGMLFHGAEVCQVLGISTPSVTIKRLVSEEFRVKLSKESNDLGQGCSVWMLRLEGLIQLAMTAKTTEAKKYQSQAIKALSVIYKNRVRPRGKQMIKKVPSKSTRNVNKTKTAK